MKDKCGITKLWAIKGEKYRWFIYWSSWRKLGDIYRVDMVTNETPLFNVKSAQTK